MIRTVASIVAAHRTGASSPEQTIAETYARIRAHDDPAIFITLARRSGRDCGGTRADKPRPEPAAVWRTGRGQGQHRRRRPADDRRLPCLRLHAGRGRDRGGSGCARPARSSSARPTSTSSRPASSACARPTASRATRIKRRPRARRLELGIGGGGRGGPRADRARHRYRGLRPRAGDAQQHRRAEAEPRPGLHLRPRAGLPHARLRLGVLAHRRRRGDGVAAQWPAQDEKDAYSRSFALAAPGACPPQLRLGVPRPSQRQFFGDRRAAAAYDAALARLAAMGATLVDIDVEPFYEAARLLYEGPWVAERYLTARS